MSLSNSLTRVIVAVLSIPLILAVCYFGKYYFLLFALGIALLSYYEFSLMAKSKGMKLNLWLGILGIIFIVFNQYFHFPLDNYNFLILFAVILCLIELFRNNGSSIYNLSGTLFGVIYMGLFSASLIGIREFYSSVLDHYNNGGFLIISVFASIWICDSAAYYGGTALGKHRLFPRVSPKKSWEGAVFGFVFALLTMIAAKYLILDFLDWNTIISFGFIIGIIGQLGDLVESLLKRDSQVKDSSHILPGHGGIFDRFDSLLLTAPVIFLYLIYVK
ncbi:MAG: phosphatidate cytidylyltransferase [Ignavibacteriaceae bacterium]|nr:phosphatidate cytidylyltransferase [Ignavibacteriaceae bacterium]